MRGLLLSSRGLSFFPQLVDQQTHLFSPGLGWRILGGEIQKISEPFLEVRSSSLAIPFFSATFQTPSKCYPEQTASALNTGPYKRHYVY